MAALHRALDAGVGLIHSNPKLRTQWAIREVLSQYRPEPPVRHLIKAEAPVDAGEGEIAARIGQALDTSCAILRAGRFHSLVLEIDAKRTGQTALLAVPAAAEAFYRIGAHAALASGHVDSVYAYCHQPEHIDGALACDEVAGVACQYNERDSWAAARLADVVATGRAFIGMSPLARGALIERDNDDADSKLAALQWALADARVSAVVITMSSVAHTTDVLHVARASHRGQRRRPEHSATLL
jgi:hypothetical protein